MNEKAILLFDCVWVICGREICPLLVQIGSVKADGAKWVVAAARLKVYKV